jgi:phage I-like protein
MENKMKQPFPPFAFCDALALYDDAEAVDLTAPPSAFMLLRFGHNNYTKDGKEAAFDFNAADAERIIADFQRRGKDLVIDYDHQSVVSGVKAPAAGWITGLDITDAGLMAQVNWTASAAQSLAAREYRYHSPVIIFEKGHPKALHSVALTNHPALHQYAPLVAQDTTNKKENSPMNDYFKSLGELLSVAVTFDDNDENAEQTAFNAICERIKALTAHEQEAQKFLTDNGANTFADVMGKMQGMCPITEKNELANRLAAIEAEKAVAQAFADGKLVEAQRAWANDYATKNLEAFSEFIAKAPVVLPLNDNKGLNKPLTNKEPECLTDAEKKIIKALGVSKEAYLKHREELNNKEDK